MKQDKESSKTVRLFDLRKECLPEGNARLTISCETDRGLFDLWFEVENKFSDYVCDDRCDFAVTATFATAMFYGYERISSDIPISKKLLYNLQYHVIPQFALMDGGKYPELVLDIPATDKTYSGTAVCTGMSGGIDSFATLFEYGHHGCVDLGGYEITHLAYNNVGAHHGHDSRLGYSSYTKRELFEGQLDKIRQFCEEYGYDLVVTDSNLSVFLAEAFGRSIFSQFHTFRNAAAAMVLQKLYRLYYYSAARNLTGFKFSFKVPSAAYEKWLLPYLDTGCMEFYNSNKAWGRLEKTQRIATIPESYKYLTVCLIGIDNCGECDKCRETLMGLDILGDDVLERFGHSFDLEKYRSENREPWFSQIYQLKDTPSFYQHDMQEIFEYGVAHDSPLIPEPELDEVFDEGAIVRIVKKHANMRKRPSSHAVKLARFEEGRALRCLGKYGPWIKVVLPNGESAYTRDRNVRLLLPVEQRDNLRGKALRNAPVRELPGKTERKILTLHQGERVQCMSKVGQWWYVKTPSGSCGYLYDRNLEVNKGMLHKAINKVMGKAGNR